MSCQSPYCAFIASSKPSVESIGLSAKMNTYSASEQTLGQYIRRDASNVVGSANSIPINAAIYRAVGSYSSALAVLSYGNSILKRGAAGECLRVE